MSQANLIQGTLIAAKQAQFALVVARTNSLVVEPLLQGAIETLVQHGVGPTQITVVRVPGAWELPWACAQAAASDEYAAIIALGAVIRGGTPHFEYVAGEAMKGCARTALDTGVPVTLGLLTTDTTEQALERAGLKGGNKGAEAALSALEMADLATKLPGRRSSR